MEGVIKKTRDLLLSPRLGGQFFASLGGSILLNPCKAKPTEVGAPSAPLFLQAEAPVIQAEALVLQAKPLLREANSLLREANSLLREVNSLPRKANSLPREANSLLLKAKPLLPEANSLLREVNSLLREADSLLTEADSSALIAFQHPEAFCPRISPLLCDPWRPWCFAVPSF